MTPRPRAMDSTLTVQSETSDNHEPRSGLIFPLFRFLSSSSAPQISRRINSPVLRTSGRQRTGPPNRCLALLPVAFQLPIKLRSKCDDKLRELIGKVVPRTTGWGVSVGAIAEMPHITRQMQSFSRGKKFTKGSKLAYPENPRTGSKAVFDKSCARRYGSHRI